MKQILYYTFMLFFIGIFTGCQSYEEKMAEFAKEAELFKSNLPPNTEVLCVITDSIATKVFYREADSSSITVYDLETDSKSTIVLDEMDYYGYNARRYNDRLFVIVETGACGSGLGNQQCVFYINVRDNSSHLVTCCEEAEFLGNGEIHIKRAFPIDVSGPSYEWEWQRDEYKLSTSLSNEEYSSREKMQEEKEETIAREERNRPKEKILRISFVQEYGGRISNVQYDGFTELRERMGYYGTNWVTVPDGKIWICKRLSTPNTLGYPLILWKNGGSTKYTGESFTVPSGNSFRIEVTPMYNNTCVIEAVFTEINEY